MFIKFTRLTKMYIELQYQWIDISILYLKHQKLQEVFKKLVD